MISLIVRASSRTAATRCDLARRHHARNGRRAAAPRLQHEHEAEQDAAAERLCIEREAEAARQKAAADCATALNTWNKEDANKWVGCLVCGLTLSSMGSLRMGSSMFFYTMI
jgi:hypothetical protein